MDPRVYRALATPLAPRRPVVRGCMDDVQVLLRKSSRPKTHHHAAVRFWLGGIEASVVNTVEEATKRFIAVNGTFPTAWRSSPATHPPKSPRSKRLTASRRSEDVRRAGKGKKIKIVAFAHGETSSG